MNKEIEIVSLDELKGTECAPTELEDILSETYVPATYNPPKKILGVLPNKIRLISFTKRRKQK